MNTPAISIVLAVKDETVNLQFAVGDILAQTFKDFELIILDDASENSQTVELIKSFTDPRIRKVYFEAHQGLAKIKNAGMKLAKGRFIAMMDADDRYPQNKLELQAAFMEENPEVFFCGTAFNLMEKNYGWQVYKKHDFIRAQFILNNPFIHPSVMFDARLVKEFEYNSEYDYAEDYDLFFRISEKYATANLPQQLISYNTSPKTGLKKQLSEKQVEYARKIREHILKQRNICPEQSEIEDYHKFAELLQGLELNKIVYLTKSITDKTSKDLKRETKRVLHSQMILYINKFNLDCSYLNYLKYLFISLHEAKLKMAIKRLKGR